METHLVHIGHSAVSIENYTNNLAESTERTPSYHVSAIFVFAKNAKHYSGTGGNLSNVYSPSCDQKQVGCKTRLVQTNMHSHTNVVTLRLH